MQEVLQKAERATPTKNLGKLTVPGPDGEPRFHDQPPLLSHVEDARARMVIASLDSYRNTLGLDRQQALDAYRPVDVTFKVVGTGSVGTRDYVVLLLGNGPEDALFLQVKRRITQRVDRGLARRGGRRDAPGQTRGGGTTPLSDGNRPIRWLDHHRWPRLSGAAAIRPQGFVGPGRVEKATCSSSMRRFAARRWRKRTPAPATPGRSPGTAAKKTASTARWRTLRSLTLRKRRRTTPR